MSIVSHCIHAALAALILTALLLGSFGVLQPVGGAARSSPSYQIESDSVNFGGGLSTSSSYTQESTFGEVATGRSISASYGLRAGYQQMQETFIGVTLSTSSITMQPALVGAFSAGSSTGSTTVTVTTDSAAGYQLEIAASSSPAMQSSLDSIADYDPAGDPDFIFTTDTNDAHFGFSPEGDDIIDRFRDNGSTACNTGSSDTPERCWDGLDTTAALIAEGSGANHPGGTATVLRFQVGLGADARVTAGTYVATTTVTALPQ